MLVFHRLFSLEQFRFPSNVEGKFVEMRYRFSDVILRAMVSASVPASSHPAEAELVGVCTGCLSPLPPLPSYWTLDGDLLQFARAHTHTHTRAHTQRKPRFPTCLPYASHKPVSAPLWFKPFTTHSCPAPRKPHSPPARAAPASWTSSPFLPAV